MGCVHHSNIWLYCQDPRFPSSISLCNDKCHLKRHLKLVFNVVAGWCIECVYTHYLHFLLWSRSGVCLERACHTVCFSNWGSSICWRCTQLGRIAVGVRVSPRASPTVHINIFSQLCTASACISMTLHSTRRGSSFLPTVTELQEILPNSWQLIALAAPRMHSKSVAKGPHTCAATGADELRENLTWLCTCRCCPS